MKESESIIVFDVKTPGLSIEEELRENRGISGRLSRRLQKNNQLYLNGKLSKGNAIVKRGDKIAILMEDE
ncbi:MAG: RluA family pseudouridine synthase, partial [Gottschalkiaceae bacterium]